MERGNKGKRKRGTEREQNKGKLEGKGDRAKENRKGKWERRREREGVYRMEKTEKRGRKGNRIGRKR